MAESFTYDAAGNLAAHTDFNGKTTTYAYDASNRPLSKTPDASFSQAPVTFTYSATGQRLSMNDASGTTTYAYDLRDRLLQKATPQGTLSYAYDAAGNLVSIGSSNAGGASVNYAYDALNRLSTVTDNRLSPGKTTYSYDNAGNLQGYLYANGVQSAFTYNTLNRLTNVGISAGTNTLASYAYTLGAAGNRTAVSELSGRQVSYGYDALHRLTGETISAGTVNGAIVYVLDAVGNRLTRTSTVAPVPPTSSTFDANDRLTSDTYDANGSTTASGSNTYGYDFENRLVTENGTAVTIVYDGNGNRVTKTVGGMTTQYLVDDRNLTGYAQVLEEIVNGTVQRVYTYGLSRISESQASGTSFYGYDGRGSVRILTDATGTVTDRYDYDAFGNVIIQTGTTPNVYLYSGEQLDSNVGFYYLRARYALPSNGRFLTADSWAGSSMDPASLHKYTYARNDPVNRTDPSGRQFTLVDLTVALAINASIESVQTIYAGQLLRTLLDVNKIAQCCLGPAAIFRNTALNLIAGGGPDWAFDLYNDSTQIEAKAYEAVAKRIGQTYREIYKWILDVDIDIKLPLIDTEIKRDISLADFAGLPDFADDLKKFDDAFNDFRLKWAVLFGGAIDSGECSLAQFLANHGGDYFDIFVSKLVSAFGEQ